MNTRRTFLKSFIGVIASVALAQRVALGALTVAPVIDEATELKINPAWVDALYEETVVFYGNITKEEKEKIAGKHPVRYNLRGGKYVEVRRLLV